MAKYRNIKCIFITTRDVNANRTLSRVIKPTCCVKSVSFSKIQTECHNEVTSTPVSYSHGLSCNSQPQLTAFLVLLSLPPGVKWDSSLKQITSHYFSAAVQIITLPFNAVITCEVQKLSLRS